MADKKTMTVNLSDAEMRALEEICEQKDLSKTAVVPGTTALSTGERENRGRREALRRGWKEGEGGTDGAMNKAQLWERQTDQVVSAELLPEMTPEQVVQNGERWEKFRVRARARLRRKRAPIPEHDHWDWDEKSHDLKFTAYRCLGIRYQDEVQGLMMISTLAVEGRLPVHKG